MNVCVAHASACRGELQLTESGPWAKADGSALPRWGRGQTSAIGERSWPAPAGVPARQTERLRHGLHMKKLVGRRKRLPHLTEASA